MTAVGSPPRYSVSERVLEHLDRGSALPGDLYTDRGLFESELRGVFGRQWLYAGHTSQLPAPGDYLTYELGDESAVVVRDRQGQVHALLNVCRHRGARVVGPGCGHARNLTCPYHQWSYRLDGSLAGAPRMGADFDPTRYPLRRLRSAVWNGLVFINFDGVDAENGSPEADADDLGELLGSSEALMAPFDIASARVAHTEVYQVDANWKLVWENAQECYHCNANHPEFIRTFDVSAMRLEDIEPSQSFVGDERMRCGVFPLKPEARSLTMSGGPASARLLGQFGHGAAPYTASTHLKPSFAAVFSPDYGIVFSDVPTGVDRTEVRVQWLVHAEAQEGVDYSVDDLIRVWDQTNRQDWELCRSVQQGVRSAGFEPGPLSLDENSVAAFYYSYARMMAEAGL